MQSEQKRAAKCLHYFKTNVRFASIVDDVDLTISQTNTKLSVEFVDLQMSDDELGSFYRGRKGYHKNEDEVLIFYRVGELARKFIEGEKVDD